MRIKLLGLIGSIILMVSCTSKKEIIQEITSEKDFLLKIKEGGKIHIRKGVYFINQTIKITKPSEIIAIGKVEINTFDLEDDVLFSIESNDVSIDNVIIKGNSAQSESNKYIFRNVNGNFRNITISNCQVSDFGDINSDTNLGVHAAYFTNIDSLSIINCQFKDVSGSAIFLKNSKNIIINKNKIENTGWYSIHFNHGCENFNITSNTIIGDKDNIRKHGGSIDLMSQHRPKGKPNRNGTIKNNTIEGIHSYGASIRILSSKNINVEANLIKNCKSNTQSPITLIRIGRRGDKESNLYNVSCDSVFVLKNIMHSGEARQRGIIIDNDYIRERNPLKCIKIEENVLSDTGGEFFEFFISLNGNLGGIADLVIKENKMNSLYIGNKLQYGIYLSARHKSGELKEVIVENNSITTSDKTPKGKKIELISGSQKINVKSQNNYLIKN